MTKIAILPLKVMLRDVHAETKHTHTRQAMLQATAITINVLTEVQVMVYLSPLPALVQLVQPHTMMR